MPYHVPIKLFAIILSLLPGSAAVADADFPRLRLDNGHLQVSIYLPDAERGYYRGTRFDWSGIIERVDYQGHRFYAPMHADHDPLAHDSVSGPAEEFAMFQPMGFAEAAAGESFVKIGVGLLAKGDSDKYQFHGDYRLLRAGEWNIEHTDDRVEFSQQLVGERGWAYRYRKTIRLLPGRAEFEIAHRLENSGERTIDINHYSHNFTLIDDLPYGPDYRVEFPFSAAAPMPINDWARLRDNAIEVDRALGDAALWLPVFVGEDPGHYNAALVRNMKTGAAVEFKGDAAITRMVFWAVERAACPEPFIQLRLEPGQSREWATRYRFTVDATLAD
jgi:hypothetical protein